MIRLNVIEPFWVQMKKLSPFSRVLLAVVGAVFLINIVFSIPEWITTFELVKKFIFFDQREDSWRPLNLALNYTLFEYPKHGLVYQYIFFDQWNKFQYPMTSLLVPYGLFKIFGAGYMLVLKHITWFCVILSIFFTIALSNLMSPPKTKVDSVIVAVSLTILTLFFYPIVKAYNLGQIQLWIDVLFFALFYCWIKGWSAPAGVFLGLICLIKPQCVVLAGWGILRKQWRFLLFFTVVMIIGWMLAVAAFGLENNLNYLDVLRHISKRGEAYFPNSSMNGLLNRFLFNGNILRFSGAFPPYHPVVYYGSMLFMLIMLASALFLPLISKRKGGMIDLSIIAITATIVSPIAWEHHYAILLPIYLFVLINLYQQKKVALLWWLAGSYFLVSNYIPVVKKLAYFEYWNVLLSYFFFGGIVLLIILYRMLFDKKTETTTP